MKEISASRFKAQCLSLMDDVAASGDEIVITKKGKPVAKLGPYRSPGKKGVYGLFKGEVRIVGDILAPLDVEWEAMKE